MALVSTVVLVVTGYAWTSLRDLGSGLSTSDVTAGPGADSSTDILLVGKDSRTDAQGNPLPQEVLDKLRAGDNEASLTDTLILLHIPKDRSRAVAYSIPRDSYVELADNYGQHKINSTFGRAKSEAAEDLREQGVTNSAELERRSAEAGRGLLVDTVEDLTGVGIDHYAEVNLLGFYKLTKAVGGVEVCLKDPVDDPYSGADFPAGRQTISGSDALAFVRQRHGLPRGGLDRVVRQQAFLAGLARSMLDTGTLANPNKLNTLFDSLQRSIVLDQGWDVLTFAQQMQGLAGGNITFDTIPVENPAYNTPEGEAIKIDPDEVRDTIRRGNKGIPPKPAPPAYLTDATVTVDNTTDITGLASRVSDDLTEADLSVAAAGNADPRSNSRVTYAPGSDKAARYVADELDGLPTTRDPGLTDGQVRVLLADDYDGPGAEDSFSPSQPLQLDGPHSQAPATPKPSDDAITASGIPCVN
ncbi:LCP family protein required for cell wall assembly [Saccharopolyspora lacisalsi]|uniref:LCP family protein required for cell wall assembly n=1 Tax=Halosaccharopolyspora lacisalsi TaxID=1000566 RepID=A0A839DWY4_9PSEU|nr:LCP family protein [Halosaccharopolyspora lacisalsi]MBA8823855.1 LCP family protein required for cell wall assembly [Halosaccharopolyspora lacisalsi]